MSKPRILIFVESKDCFGHANILDMLGRELHGQDAQIGVASDSLHNGADEIFSFDRMTHFPLPYTDLQDGTVVYGPDRRPYGPREIVERREAVRAACDAFQPDLVLFDIYPLGRQFREHDAQACRQWMAERGKPVPMVSLARDIMFTSEPARSLALLERQFDEVLVRGDGELVRLEESIPDWSGIGKPLHYLGNIVAAMPPRSRPASAADPVVVSAGGGYQGQDDFDYLAKAIQARRHAGELAARPWHVVIGKACPPENWAALQALAHREAPDSGITLTPVLPHQEFQQGLADAAAVIARGGYNTCFELASIGKPFLVIPRPYSREAALRGEIMERHGYSGNLPQQADPQAYGHALNAEYCARRSPPAVDRSGAPRIAARLLALAREASTPAATIAANGPLDAKASIAKGR